MESKIRNIIQEIYSDTEAACAEWGESLDAESLADGVCDRLCDTSAAYLAMPYEQRRALVLKICKEYC